MYLHLQVGMMMKMKCFRCGSELKVEECEDIDYPFYCPVCDENMYMFEVVEDD